jgi:hypothetical protein
MEEFVYKEYSEEESRIYSSVLNTIMERMQEGMKLPQACRSMEVDDEGLRALIVDDALKVLLADLHFVKGLSPGEAAEIIGVPLVVVEKALVEMLEDIEISSDTYIRKSTGEAAGNA